MAMDRNAFDRGYQESLLRFMAEPDEELRLQAYALGREALEGELGIMGLAQLHVLAASAGPLAGGLEGERIQRSAEFFAEAAAPFEMELRGYREALARNEALLLQAQRVESMGLMVAGIVHDFNNLLGIIHGYTELALEDPALKSSPDLRQTLQEVNKASERAAGLTKQLLSFSRSHANEPQDLDLNAFVSETGKMIKRVLGPGVELEQKLAPGMLQLRADPNQLAQVLMNLSINARDAMPGGGKITLKTTLFEQGAAAAGEAQALAAGRYALLEVVDTGTGMDAATQARIFEPFFSTKGPGKGTGLGLATVYSIVKESHGVLRLESSPGRGSRFQIYWPALAGSAHSTETQVAAASLDPSGKERLLIVDNEESVRKVGAAFLRKAGYSVLEASSGAQALDLAAVLPDLALLVTDVEMPGMSGLDLARKLRHSRPKLKVLYLSGSLGGAQPADFSPELNRDFLGKPYPGALLIEKVQGLIQGERP